MFILVVFFIDCDATMAAAQSIFALLERELEDKPDLYRYAESIVNADNEYDVLYWTADALDIIEVDDVYIMKLLIRLATAKLDELNSE